MADTVAPSRPEQAHRRRAEMSDLETPAGVLLVGAALQEDGRVLVEWEDGRRARFHAIWLRDNCACPDCRHPKAMERQFLFIDGPEQVAAARVDLTEAGDLLVLFAPAEPGAAPHLAAFHAGWLRSHCYADWARRERATRVRSWDGGSIPTVDYAAVMTTDAGLTAWLAAMRDSGLVLLRNAPAVPGTSLRIAGRVGPVRRTNFGELYDVVSMPNPNASAYTPIALEPHTDLANWRRPPDFQLLFCVENAAVGGGSILVDGLAAAEELRTVDPEAFATLVRHPIDFRFHDESCDIRHRAPTIQLDGDGNVTAVRFNNWLRSTLDVAEEAVEPTYRALRRFWGLLRDSRFQVRLRLAAGDLVTFDNSRVLHGREAFDPNTGRRHLQGCYLDRDTVLSRLRMLERVERS